MVMRGALFAATMAASAVFYARESACEGTYKTTWYFRVAYSSGQFSESVDETNSGPVLMPTGSSWKCSRQAASLTKGGRIMAGWSCSSGSGWVNVLAACPGTAAGDDMGSAQLGTGQDWTNFTVRCATAAATPPAPKSVDRGI